MDEIGEYVGVALNGPLKGRTLRCKARLCLAKDRRGWWFLIFGKHRMYAYAYTAKGWVFDQRRSSLA